MNSKNSIKSKLQTVNLKEVERIIVEGNKEIDPNWEPLIDHPMGHVIDWFEIVPTDSGDYDEIAPCVRELLEEFIQNNSPFAYSSVKELVKDNEWLDRTNYSHHIVRLTENIEEFIEYSIGQECDYSVEFDRIEDPTLKMDYEKYEDCDTPIRFKIRLHHAETSRVMYIYYETDDFINHNRMFTCVLNPEDNSGGYMLTHKIDYETFFYALHDLMWYQEVSPKYGKFIDMLYVEFTLTCD